MTTTPILGTTELVEGQAVPETTVNEAVRYLEQGAGWFVFKDRDLATPPGSPADGDAYLVAASGTGDWSGQDGNIAFYMSTAWVFITPREGMAAWVNDENVSVAFNGTTWAQIGGGASSGSATWDFNFAADGYQVIRASEAMTITQQATTGTGTVAYEKSTAAAPDTFASTTSPITLEAGAKLKVTASSVAATYAVHLERTA